VSAGSWDASIAVQCTVSLRSAESLVHVIREALRAVGGAVVATVEASESRVLV